MVVNHLFAEYEGVSAFLPDVVVSGSNNDNSGKYLRPANSINDGNSSGTCKYKVHKKYSNCMNKGLPSHCNNDRARGIKECQSKYPQKK